MKKWIAFLLVPFFAAPLLASTCCSNYYQTRAKEGVYKSSTKTEEKAAAEDISPLVGAVSTCQTRVDDAMDKTTAEKVQRCLTEESQEFNEEMPKVLVSETYDVEYPGQKRVRQQSSTRTTRTVKTYTPSEAYQAYYDSEYPSLHNDILPTLSAEEAHATALRAIRGETEEEIAATTDFPVLQGATVGAASSAVSSKSSKSGKSVKSSVSRKSSTDDKGFKHTVTVKETKIVINGDPNAPVQQTQVFQSDLANPDYDITTTQYFDPSPVDSYYSTTGAAVQP